MKTPAQLLAKKVLDRLRDEKLLSPAEVKKLLPKFAAGNVMPEDWQLAVENSLEDEAKE